MIELSKAEETFLIAIYHLKDNAYGVSICEKIEKITGKLYTYGTLYKLLDQIVRRGYVTKKEGEPSSERGGRRKLFYELTDYGTKAIQETYRSQISLWQGVNWDSINSDN